MRRAAMTPALVSLLGLVAFGCDTRGEADGGAPTDAPTARDAGGDAGGDAGPSDAGSSDAGDAGSSDAGSSDAGSSDAGSSDAGPSDAGSSDAGPSDAGSGDAGLLDAGAPDAGAPDAGPPDAGPVDAGPPPVTCSEPGLVLETITETASVGTPDSYFRDVTPGDPFCAEITGGGSGSWGVVVSNGTSSGIYCNDVPNCAVRVRPGDTTLIVTAVTSDIGGYTLRIRRVPP